jgi:putative flippase GtrA
MNSQPSGIINRKVTRQMFHYGVFGVLRNSLGYAAYLLITYLGVDPKIAMSFLYIVGAAVGFLWSRNFIFIHKGHLGGAGVRYLAAHIFGYLINLSILIVMVDKLGYAHQWVQVVAIFIVAGFLFLSFKFFVFGEIKLPEERSSG